MKEAVVEYMWIALSLAGKSAEEIEYEFRNTASVCYMGSGILDFGV